MSKSSSEIIANGSDAMKWAEDFIAICHGAEKLDKMEVFGWFANVIQAQKSIQAGEAYSGKADTGE